MKQKERIKLSTNPRPRHAIRRRMQVLLCLIAVLAIATTGLGVYHTLTVGNHQEQTAVMSDQLTALENQVKALESQQADSAGRLAQQEDTIRSLEQVVESQATQLAKQKKTIATQKKQIAALKKVTTTKTVTAATGSTKKTTAKVTTTTRKITFKPAKTTTVPVTAAKTDKLIALTFDDGPDEKTTAKLLDALKKRGIPATFFVLGNRINDKTAPLLKRMEAEGHVVGNHSMNHKNLRNLSPAAIKKEMDACSNKIEAVLGHKPTIMRCPGGNYNDEVRLYARNADMAVIQWSVDTRDWESRNVTSIMTAAFDNSYSKIQDGAIVLMHDIYPTTIDAAIKMMDRLLKEGYTMVTVPELLTLRKGGAAAGEIYNSAI